jgi:hypothetical protein
MSVRVLARVWDGYPGGGSELLTLLALADWSDDDGHCFPSIQKIAEKVRLKERQAQRVVHSLIADGFVLVTGNALGGAPGSSRRYRLNLSRLTGVAHDTPTGVASDTPRRQTGVTEDGDGCHPRRETGVSHDTLTVSEPSKNRQLIADEPLVSSKAADPCPHQAIIDLYHQTLPTGRQVRIWNETRKAKLRARWKEDLKRQSLDWWAKFFGYIANSDFLTGKTSTPGRRPFEIDLEWIVTHANFVKILEGKYENGQAAIMPAAPAQQEAIFRGCL